MYKYKKSLIQSILAVSIIIFFTECKKDTRTPLNITLYDKPLDSVQLYTIGQWKLSYFTSGINSNNKVYINDQYWKISIDHIAIVDSGQTIVDTSAQWVYKLVTNTGVDTTWTLRFADKVAPFGYTYFIDEIQNDELIIHETSLDAFYLHFIKQ